MHLSKRLLYFLIPLAIPIILVTTVPILLYIGCFYFLLLLCVSVVDYVTNPFIKGIEINREVNSKFSLGVENSVVLNIINRTEQTVNLTIKDDFPDEFIYKNIIHKSSVQSSDSAQLTYHLTPIRRGFTNLEIYMFAVWEN